MAQRDSEDEAAAVWEGTWAVSRLRGEDSRAKPGNPAALEKEGAVAEPRGRERWMEEKSSWLCGEASGPGKST